MAIRANYRLSLQPEAQRLARLLLWGIYDQRNARLEMRYAVRRIITPRGYDAELKQALTVAIHRSLAERPGDEGELNDAIEATLDPFRDRHPWSPEWRTFADELLAEAVTKLDAILDQHTEALRQVATRRFQAGAWGREVLDAVIAAARQLEPMPPAWLVEQVAAPPRPLFRLQPQRRRLSFQKGAGAHA